MCIAKAELLAELFPTSTSAAGGKPKVLRTFREVLTEWKQLRRSLDADSLRKYDEVAAAMEKWRPTLRPATTTQVLTQEYGQHLLDQQRSDATIRVHLRGSKCRLETLGLPAAHKWLEYSAKNAPQLL